MTTATFTRGDHVTVRGHRGVAWWVLGPEMEQVPAFDEDDPMFWTEDGDYIGPDGSDPDDWEERDTGRLVCRMIGDDMDFVFDPDDLTKIDDDEFCPSCGQVGCGWGH